MKKTKFSYLFYDIPENTFDEIDENFLDEETQDEIFLDEFSEYSGYLTESEYLRKYYGIVTH